MVPIKLSAVGLPVRATPQFSSVPPPPPPPLPLSVWWCRQALAAQSASPQKLRQKPVTGGGAGPVGLYWGQTADLAAPAPSPLARAVAAD